MTKPSDPSSAKPGTSPASLIPLTRAILSAALIFLPLLTLNLHASGSYRHSAVPDKNSDLYNEGLDVPRFELGRKLFAGMIRLSEPDTSTESVQTQRLQDLGKKIPASQSKSTERMQRMAGRLTKDQIEALEYFVQERFSTRTLASKGK